MRSKLFLILSVLMLTLAACGPSAVQPRTLSVAGSGSVYLNPDIAYVYIGVHTENADIAQAVSSNNTQAQAVVQALSNSGVDAKDIQTSNFSVYSSQVYDKMTGQPTSGTTFDVDNTVYVTVRDLSKLGSLLDTAIRAGANNINSVSFDVADKTAAMVQARQKAMQDASSLAAELSKNAGLKLGDIQTVSYTDNGMTPYYTYGVGGGGGPTAGKSTAPINPGQLQLTATVNVTYYVK